MALSQFDRKLFEFNFIKRKIIFPNFKKLANAQAYGIDAIVIKNRALLNVSSRKKKKHLSISQLESQLSVKYIYFRREDIYYVMGPSLLEYAKKILPNYDELVSKIDFDKELNTYLKTLKQGKKRRQKKSANKFSKREHQQIATRGLSTYVQNQLEGDQHFEVEQIFTFNKGLYVQIKPTESTLDEIKRLYDILVTKPDVDDDLEGLKLKEGFEALNIDPTTLIESKLPSERRFAVIYGTGVANAGLIDSDLKVRLAAKQNHEKE